MCAHRHEAEEALREIGKTGKTGAQSVSCQCEAPEKQEVVGRV